MMTVFQSTPSAWRETSKIFFILIAFDISIHSLRMEGDSPPFYYIEVKTFQSTPSAWRETILQNP